MNNPYSEVISTHSTRQADRQSRCSKPAESCNYFVLNCSPVTRVDWIRSNVLLPCARTYLQPHYGNGVYGNVYLLAGQH